MSLPTASGTRFGFVRQYPVDLALASVIAVGAYFLVTELPAGSHLRLAIALPLVVFLPGYALVAALFPANAQAAREQAATAAQLRPGGIDTVERLGLSLALSLAVVPMVVLALAPTEWHLTTASVAGGLTVVTVALAQLGVIRRLRIPEPDRYAVSPRAAFDRLRGPNEGAVATASSFLLVLGIVAASIALLSGFIAPQAAGGFTELGLFAEDEDGELVADDLPDELEPGESTSVVVSVENQEGEDRSYTIVAQEQRLEDGDVVERASLDEFQVDVADGETETLEREITPTAEDETVRIVFMLYEDEPPADPTRADAQEDVYFWVTVTEDASVEEAGIGEEGSADEGESEDEGDGESDAADDESSASVEADESDEDDGSIFDQLFGDEEEE